MYNKNNKKYLKNNEKNKEIIKQYRYLLIFGYSKHHLLQNSDNDPDNNMILSIIQLQRC